VSRTQVAAAVEAMAAMAALEESRLQLEQFVSRYHV
jgi:hypothetical protein